MKKTKKVEEKVVGSVNPDQLRFAGKVEQVLEAFKKTKTFLYSQGHSITEVSVNVHYDNANNGPGVTVHAICSK